ncbi:MAG: L-threonylcarbamoyladenylate synthase [Phycisphaerales bacterium]
MTEILEGPEAIVAAVARLGLGEPIAFPTETVYGLGADALDHDAVARIFALKGRPSNNPLIVHVSGSTMAQDLVDQWTPDAQKLAEEFWPGALTLVLKKSESVPDIVTAGGPTVAVRCPGHPIALALIESLGKPLVGPSANPSGWISPTTSAHVAEGFDGHDLLILEGGSCRAGIESTVLDLTSDQPAVLRLGIVSASKISRCLGVTVTANDPRSQPDHKIPPTSPGLLGAHYQPKTPTSLRDPNELSDAHDGVYLIGISDQSSDFPGIFRLMPRDPVGYAHELYAAMHEGDASSASEIWIERVPEMDDADADRQSDAPLWAAVMERLRRACR